jgi:hypothetical protein
MQLGTNPCGVTLMNGLWCSTLSAGDEVPKARDALGWHIAVYWKDDKQFYPGQVADFDPSNGKHKVGWELDGRPPGS